jgi:hypothetical protein
MRADEKAENMDTLDKAKAGLAATKEKKILTKADAKPDGSKTTVKQKVSNVVSDEMEMPKEKAMEILGIKRMNSSSKVHAALAIAREANSPAKKARTSPIEELDNTLVVSCLDLCADVVKKANADGPSEVWFSPTGKDQLGQGQDFGLMYLFTKNDFGAELEAAIAKDTICWVQISGSKKRVVVGLKQGMRALREKITSSSEPVTAIGTAILRSGGEIMEYGRLKAENTEAARRFNALLTTNFMVSELKNLQRQKQEVTSPQSRWYRS